MIYKIIDNFLDKKTCEELIKDANLFSDSHIEALNKRMLLMSTSLRYQNLLNKSPAWNKLHLKINSNTFLNFALENLEIKKKFEITNFYNTKKPSSLLKRFKDLNNKSLSIIGNLNLIFYLFYKFYRNIVRNFKYKFTFKSYVELLYDYSKSPNGYKREIHRDSDARTIVFLLYLNDLSKDSSGGNLEIYRYLKKGNIPSQPKEEDCELIQSIEPKSGRIILFLNSSDSLHAVDEMRNNDGYRHFLYGSFTLLAKKNPLIKKSKGALKTNYNVFD